MTLASGLYSRNAALAALGAAIAAVFLLVMLLVVGVSGFEREAAADNLRQLGLYRAEIAARPQVEAALRQLRAASASMPGLLQGPGGAQAAADIQNAVREIVESNGGEIRSTQVLPSTHMRGFEVVNVQYDLTVPVTKLRDLTYAIETHTPYLFLDAIDISAPFNWDTGSATTAPVLEVRWTVSAYRLAETK